MTEIFDELGTLVSAKTSFRNVKGEPKAYTEIVFKPFNGEGAREYMGEGLKRGAFQESLIENGSQNVLTALQPGSQLTLKVVLNESGGRTYKNISSIVAGHVENPNKVPFETKSSGGATASSSGGDYNTRAANGQAGNMALLIACHEGRQHDFDYVTSLLPYARRLGEAAQNVDAPQAAVVPTQAAAAVPPQGVLVPQTTTLPPTAPIQQPIAQQAVAQTQPIANGSIGSEVGNLF